jgi:hypothetical protein
MESVAGQIFGLQVLVTTLVSRIANQQPDPEGFVRDLRGDALNGVRTVPYEIAGDVAKARAAAAESVNELLDLLARGAPRNDSRA